MKRLLCVVDDDHAVRDSLHSLLTSAGHQVETFASAEELLQSGVLRRFACLILDVWMEGMSGPDLQALLVASPDGAPPIVFVTARDDPATRERVYAAGAAAWLEKPFDSDVLLSVIATALRDAPASQ